MNLVQAIDFSQDRAITTEVGVPPALVVYVPISQHSFHFGSWRPIFRSKVMTAYLVFDTTDPQIALVKRGKRSDCCRYKIGQKSTYCTLDGSLLVTNSSGATLEVTLERLVERPFHSCQGCSSLHDDRSIIGILSKDGRHSRLTASTFCSGKRTRGLFVGCRQTLELRNEVDGSPIFHNELKPTLLREGFDVCVLWGQFKITLPSSVLSAVGGWWNNKPDLAQTVVCGCGATEARLVRPCGHVACERCLESECDSPIHSWLSRSSNPATAADREDLGRLVAECLGSSCLSLSPLGPPSPSEPATFLGTVEPHNRQLSGFVSIYRLFYFRGYVCVSDETGLRTLGKLRIPKIRAVAHEANRYNLLYFESSDPEDLQGWHCLKYEHTSDQRLRVWLEAYLKHVNPIYWKCYKGIFDTRTGATAATDFGLPMLSSWPRIDGLTNRGELCGLFSLSGSSDFWGGLCLKTQQASRVVASRDFLPYGPLVKASSRSVLRMLRSLGDEGGSRVAGWLGLRPVSSAILVPGTWQQKAGAKLLEAATRCEALADQELISIQAGLDAEEPCEVCALPLGLDKFSEEGVYEWLLRTTSTKKFMVLTNKHHIAAVRLEL